MKFMLISGVVLLLVMQRAAQLVLYLFCILLFGYGSFVMLRDLKTWVANRRMRRSARVA